MSNTTKNNKIEDLNYEFNRLLTQKPFENSSYYCFSFFADENGTYSYSVMSHWTGWADQDFKIEIREPSLINPKSTISLFEKANQPALIINDDRDLAIYLCFLGGNSIIEKTIAESFLGHVIKPTKNIFTYDKGFVDKSSIDIKMFNRAATPKVRMKIFNRDNRRCKICGASPKNNEHVELHLHHIMPYSKGGLTTENNLITLCHTCHKGLDPHLDYSLYDEINIGLFSERLSKEPYLDRIRRNIKFAIENAKAKQRK